MPAATYRAQFIFNQVKNGWTETWYLQGSDFTDATTKALRIAAALAVCRSIHTTLETVRVTQVDPQLLRISTLTTVNYAGLQPDSAAEAEDVVSTSAFNQGGFFDQSKRSVFLRGLSDLSVARDPNTGESKPLPAFLAALTAMKGVLISIPVLMRRQNTGNPLLQITKVQVDPVVNTWTQLVGPAQAFPAIGDTVKFTGYQSKILPWLKGNWIVQDRSGTSLTIAYPYNYATPFLPAKMRAEKVTYIYPALTTLVFSEFRERKTGRPINLTRGRSSGIHWRR